MSQPWESSSQKRREKVHRRRPENPSHKDRSRTTPANESQVWNGDVDNESDTAGTEREDPDTRGRADEEDEK